MLLHRRRRRPTPSSTPPQHIRPLPDFATLPRVGWRWERWKTADENWLDLAYLVARASEAKDGHMGCCIVRDPHGREPSLISTTINCGSYGRYRSDLHAEAAAVSDCARRGEKLEGCTLYVTRAPCPRCHCLIAAAGIRRVVAPTDLETEACVVSAEEFGIDYFETSAKTGSFVEDAFVHISRDVKNRLEREKPAGPSAGDAQVGVIKASKEKQKKKKCC